jgi:GNAT superfamily N-acetyltransferase
MLPTEPVLRRLSVGDAAACAGLGHRVNWSHDVPTWERCIEWSGENALCLTLNDQIITTALVLGYSERLAWVGMVITDPDYQGRGFAKKLMLVVMEQPRQKVASIMLDASTLGFPLYQKLGFRSLYPVEVYEGTAAPGASPTAAEVVQADNLADIIALDAEIMGVPRPDVIRFMAQSAWVMQENGRISGYLLAQRDNRGVHIGPWYDSTPQGAHDLLQAALNTFAGQPLRLQIPQPNTHALAFARQHGWNLNRTGTRMVLGAEAPGRMAEQYGIAGFPTG